MPASSSSCRLVVSIGPPDTVSVVRRTCLVQCARLFNSSCSVVRATLLFPPYSSLWIQNHARPIDDNWSAVMAKGDVWDLESFFSILLRISYILPLHLFISHPRLVLGFFFYPRSLVPSSPCTNRSLAPWRVPHWCACVSGLVLSWRGKKRQKEGKKETQEQQERSAMKRETESETVLTPGNEGKNGRCSGKVLAKTHPNRKEREGSASSFVETRV